MRSLVLRSWSTGGRWYRRNGRARGQIAAAGPRERWFRRSCMAAMMYVLWRLQCRWALECRQAGERQRATAAGLLDCWTARQIRGVWCLDETTKSELTGGMCGAAVLGHNAVSWSVGRMDCTVDGCEAVRCGAQRARRDETRDRRDETGETRHTRHTRHTRRWWQAGRPAWHCFRVAAPVHRPFHRPSRKRLE